MPGSIVTNRYGVAEPSALRLPRKVDPTRRAVIYAHGNNNPGRTVYDGAGHPGLVRHVEAWQDAGLVILAGDFGGLSTFGNDAGLAALETAVTWLLASGLCAADKVLLTGSSMGDLSALRYAAEHPDRVALISTFMPAVDPEDIRTRDAQAAREPINTAWTLPAGSYVGGADQTPLPTRGRPLARTADVAGIPTHFWYSSGDTVCTAAAVDAYAAARPGVTKHLVSTTAPHSDAIPLAAPISEVRDLLLAYAAT